MEEAELPSSPLPSAATPHPATKDEGKAAQSSSCSSQLTKLTRRQLLEVLNWIEHQPQGEALIQSALSQLTVTKHDLSEGQGQGGGDGSGAKTPSSSSSKSKKKQLQSETKEFDFSRYSSRHIALQLAYDGDKYSGFASQGDRPEETVEKHLLAALEKTKLIKDRAWARYSRCGRTDKGVSALRQVVGLRVRSNRPKQRDQDGVEDQALKRAEDDDGVEEEANEMVVVSGAKMDASVEGEMDYCTVLNRVLPSDIRVLGWAPVPDSFSARFCASYRTYRYFFDAEGLDVSKMAEAAALLVGDHDFRNLCKMDATAVSNFRRVIHYTRISTVGQWVWNQVGSDDTSMATMSPCRLVCCLEIRGQAFLWHMVRCIMAVLFMVGRGLEPPSINNYLLDTTACPRKPYFTMASEEPLVLHDCGFQGLGFYYRPEPVYRLWQELKEQWSRVVVKLARLENMMEFLASVEMRGEDVEEWASSRQSGSKGKRKGGEGGGDVKKVKEENGGAVVWRDVMAKYLVGSGTVLAEEQGKGKQQASKFVPLRERPGEKTYEERVAEMTGKKKEKFQENNSKRQQAPPDELEVHKRYRTTLEMTK